MEINAGLIIIIGALVIACLLYHFGNKSLRNEKDFYKKKAIDVGFRKGGAFKNRLKIENALNREYMQRN